MLDERLPAVSAAIIEQSTRGAEQSCLGALQRAADTLDREGFVMRPSWHDLQRGRRLPLLQNMLSLASGSMAGSYHASSSSEFHFRETLVLAQSCTADQAHLRSHSGLGASAVLHGAPTGPEFKATPEQLRTLTFERLPLPVQITDARCERGAALDTQARHRAACARFGRLRSRALGPERTLARVRREAGATVHVNAKLRDMNVAVRADEMRLIEVLASGLPLHNGAQLAVDVTLRCALTAASQACPNAATVNGGVWSRARADKEVRYTELVEGDRCGLIVVALETGGRWSEDAMTFINDLAAAKAREAPPVLRRIMFLAWQRRWSRMIATSCRRACACSLVSEQGSFFGVYGAIPDLAHLSCEA